MKILGHCPRLPLALGLALLIVGFSNPLPAEDKTVPQSSNGAGAVPTAPAVKETAPQ